jgi:hypothetical protein
MHALVSTETRDRERERKRNEITAVNRTGDADEHSWYHTYQYSARERLCSSENC